MKFILLVEGETEDTGVPGFLNRWLSSQFEQGVGVQSVRFEGWSELRDDAPKRAKIFLTEHAYRDVIAVVSLLDLHGPTFYPADKTSVRDRYLFGQAYMEERVRVHFERQGLPASLASKYRHYFAVHEIEAWMLTDPSLFHKDVRQALMKQRPPEETNFDKHPGKLLEELYLKHVKRAYKKTTAGRALPRKSLLPRNSTCLPKKWELCPESLLRKTFWPDGMIESIEITFHIRIQPQVVFYT